MTVFSSPSMLLVFQHIQNLCGAVNAPRIFNKEVEEIKLLSGEIHRFIVHNTSRVLTFTRRPGAL